MALPTRLTSLFGIKYPLLQAPMAGFQGADMAAAVARAGGLGALPCAYRTAHEIRSELASFRAVAGAEVPINLNFFCHNGPAPDAASTRQFVDSLSSLFSQHGVTPPATLTARMQPFDEEMADLLISEKVPVASFHFGPPAPELVAKLKDAGLRLIASATSRPEARHLEDAGFDAVIAQSVEAGGHQARFMPPVGDPMGTLSLVPQICDAIGLPVIAAGGLSDGRGVAAAFTLGADAVQVGTAYLKTPQAAVTKAHRKALDAAGGSGTRLTNLFTGQPARTVNTRLFEEMPALDESRPAFPYPAEAWHALRARADANEHPELYTLWAGQAAALATPDEAETLTHKLISDAEAILLRLAASPIIDDRGAYI